MGIIYIERLMHIVRKDKEAIKHICTVAFVFNAFIAVCSLL